MEGQPLASGTWMILRCGVNTKSSGQACPHINVPTGCGYARMSLLQVFASPGLLTPLLKLFH